MNEPLVSAICCTYGRCPRHQHLLSEAVESFVRQDYPNKELILFNDAPGQTLVCDVPGVRVFNLPERIPTLGAKFNAAIREAAGSLIVSWDDDDINLPQRISQGVAAIGDHDYWNPQRTWYVPVNQYGMPTFHWDHNHGVCHNASIFRKSAWEKVGGYPDVSGPQDSEMDMRLKTLSVAPVEKLHPRDWQYVYMWSRSPCHLSGMGATDEAYRKWGEQPVVQGTFRITPSWRMDYKALAKAATPKD